MARKPSKNIAIVKANELVEASYQLTLSEKRILLLVISRLDSRQNPESQAQRHTLHASEVSVTFGVSLRQAYTLLKEGAEHLAERWLIIHQQKSGKSTVTTGKTRWVSGIWYRQEEGCVDITLAFDILPYLTQIKRSFTQYRLAAVASMSSVYAIRLYELLVQWRGAGEREVEIDWLRERFQIVNAYTNIRDLKRWVIKPAVDQINEYSDLWVKWDQRKSGRSVVALIFTFGPKSEKNAAPEQPTPKKPMTMKEMERAARPGESWDELKRRLGVGR